MNVEIKNINEFQAGNRIDGFFLIKTVECKSSSNNKKYLDFTFADKTGEINAKLWNCEEEDKVYLPNTLIKARGMITEWQNTLQFKIEKIRKAKEEDGVSISDFVQVAPYSPEDMFNMVIEFRNKINNKDLKDIVDYILDEYKDTLMYYPAAKSNHHSIRGGLLYHITTMLRAGEKLSEIYTFVNTDLLYAGIILHDISKMEEMASSELGIVSEYTIEGQLIGHIVMAVKKIEAVSEKLGTNKETKMLLEHMILSHHYEPEYGSPKKPMIPEAEMLHRLDDLDAKMYDMKKALEGVEAGEMSDRVWSLEKRSVYKRKDC